MRSLLLWRPSSTLRAVSFLRITYWLSQARLRLCRCLHRFAFSYGTKTASISAPVTNIACLTQGQVINLTPNIHKPKWMPQGYEFRCATIYEELTRFAYAPTSIEIKEAGIAENIKQEAIVFQVFN